MHQKYKLRTFGFATLTWRVFAPGGCTFPYLQMVSEVKRGGGTVPNHLHQTHSDPTLSAICLQVEAILSSRLQTLPWPVVDPQALEACARNVSQNIGDLRHALKVGNNSVAWVWGPLAGRRKVRFQGPSVTCMQDEPVCLSAAGRRNRERDDSAGPQSSWHRTRLYAGVWVAIYKCYVLCTAIAPYPV